MKNSIAHIGRFAFTECVSLTTITIPNSVSTIDSFAFYFCSNLTSIIIPDRIISIGESVFMYCNKLTIYAEVLSKPLGWHPTWNQSNRPVIWGYVE